MSGQTVQAQIRLLLEKQSDQVSSPFALKISIYMFLVKYFKNWHLSLNFRLITARFFLHPKI